MVQEDALDDVDEKEWEEPPDVEREDVDDVDDTDARDDVEGNREEGYKDLLDNDGLCP